MRKIGTQENGYLLYSSTLLVEITWNNLEEIIYNDLVLLSVEIFIQKSWVCSSFLIEIIN